VVRRQGDIHKPHDIARILRNEVGRVFRPKVAVQPRADGTSLVLDGVFGRGRWVEELADDERGSFRNLFPLEASNGDSTVGGEEGPNEELEEEEVEAGKRHVFLFEHT